jgi:hypothetical protein
VVCSEDDETGKKTMAMMPIAKGFSVEHRLTSTSKMTVLHRPPCVLSCCTVCHAFSPENVQTYQSS